jgi:hypothetical protein
MTACPNRLLTLLSSGIIGYGEVASLSNVFGVMILQIMEDANPLAFRSEHYPMTGNETWIWEGTPLRIASYLRDLLYKCEQHFEDEPITTTHEHGDGACKFDPDYPDECELESLQEEIDNRALILREKEEACKADVIEAQLAMLEEYGLIEGLRTPDDGGTLKSPNGQGGVLRAGLNLKVNLKEGKGEGLKTPRPTHLSNEVEVVLLEAGTDANLVRFVSAWPGYAKVLNNPFSGDLSDAPRLLAKMMSKEGATERFEQWLKKHPEEQTS